MATINLMVVVTLCMQGILIAVSTRVIKSYRGVWQAAIATLTLAAGFLIITLVRPPMESRFEPFGTQFLFICGYALIYLAICRFTNRPYSKWILYGVAPAGLLALIVEVSVTSGPMPYRITSLVVGTVLFGSTAITIWMSDHRRYRLSAHITAVTLACFSISMLVQLIASLFSADVVLPVGTATEKVLSLMFFVLSFAWTAGFILMVSQRLQSDLNELAMNDALTRVRNRRAMDQLLDFEMDRVHAEMKDFSIILIDIDRFKHINDTYGHDVGDRVLQWFASTLQTYMRVQDVVARWGGEEFLILLPGTSLEDAAKIAERLRKLIEASEAEVPDGNMGLTFSAGVSSSNTNRDVKDLCRVADQALYVAKKKRNLVATQDEITD